MNLNHWRYNSSSRPVLVYSSYMEKDLFLLLRIISTWNVYFFPESLSFSIRNNYPLWSLFSLSLTLKADDFLILAMWWWTQTTCQVFPHLSHLLFFLNICIFFSYDSTWKSLEHTSIISPKFYLGGSVFSLYLISALLSSIIWKHEE